MRGRPFGTTRPAARPRRRRLDAGLERLEERRLLATFNVSRLDDPAGAVAGTLRDAIVKANAAANSGGPDLINFQLSGSGIQTITLTRALPAITDSVTIDGGSQPGFVDTPLIEVSGAGAGTADGFLVQAANTKIQSLIINNFESAGIRIEANGVTVVSNYIGTSADGTAAAPNGSGIFVTNASSAVIGGAATNLRNVISGNTGAGIRIGASTSNHAIQGNYIGTDVTGNAPLGNLTGIEVFGGLGTVIGGAVTGQGNVISGNTTAGIQVSGGNAQNTAIRGNFIGTNPNGTLALGNGGVGVIVQNAGLTTIGGTAPGTGNVIGNNIGSGVELNGTTNVRVQGNAIGTNFGGSATFGNGVDGVSIVGSSGVQVGGVDNGASNLIAFNVGDGVGVDDASAGNPILSNSIYLNDGLGIDLGPDGVTTNDGGDGDTGANNLQNYPVITLAGTGAGRTTIQGTLNSQPNTTYLIQFFSQRTADPSGNGEGRTLIGSLLVTTDNGGNAGFNTLLSTPTVVNDFVTATATTQPSVSGETSEFSVAVPIGAAQLADLSVVIEDSPDPAIIGLPLTYTVTVTNAGPDTATNVQFNFNLPPGVTVDQISVTPSQGNLNVAGGVVSGSLGNIGISNPVVVTIRVIPNQIGTFSASASAISGQIDIDNSNNSDTETTVVNRPADVQLVGNQEPDPGVVGQPLTYAVILVNNGPGVSSNTVVTSELPANVSFISALSGQGTVLRQGNQLTFQVGSIAVGGVVAIRVTVIPNSTGFFSETFTASATETDQVPSNNVLTINARVVPEVDLTAAVSANITQVTAGNVVTFTVTATNNGPSPSTNVVLSSTFPTDLLTFSGGSSSAGGSVGFNNGVVLTVVPTLDPGETATLTFMGTARDVVSGVATVDATVNSNESGDLVPGNNAASTSILVNPIDLVVTPSVNTPSGVVNQPLTFRFDVANNGPADATNVKATVSLSPNLFLTSIDTPPGVTAGDPSADGVVVITIDSIPAGTTRTFFLTAVPDSPGFAGARIQLVSDQVDAVGGDEDELIVVPVGQADLAVGLLANPSSVFAGEPATFSGLVLNNGPVTATATTARLTFSSGVEIVSATSSAGATTISGNVVTINIGDLPAGAAGATFTAIVRRSTVGPITGTVVVSTTGFDSQPGNNTATATVDAINAPGVIQFAAPSVLVLENQGVAQLTLTRTSGSLGAVSVGYTTADGSAIAGVNYTATAGVVNFAPGERTKTIDIPLLVDGRITALTAFGVVLSSPTNGASIGTQGGTVVFIQNTDADPVPPSFTDIQLIGAGASISAVVLQLSEPIEPSGADDPANYAIISPSGVVLPTFPPVYDPFANTVTLVLATPIRGAGFSFLLVNPFGLRDFAGNPLDGDGDGVAGGGFVGSFARGSRLTYNDADGDRVSVNIDRGGFLDMIRDPLGTSRVLRVNAAPGGRSTLSGSVRRNRFGGDGQTNLGAITGVGFGSINSRLTTPPFFTNLQLLFPGSPLIQGLVVPTGRIVNGLRTRRA